MSNHLVIGCGYVGHRVATSWKNDGKRVFALTRSTEKAEQFARDGIEPIVFKIGSNNPLPELGPLDSVLISLGFDRTTGQTYREVICDGLLPLVDALAGTPKIIYLSSTGVYGQPGRPSHSLNTSTKLLQKSLPNSEFPIPMVWIDEEGRCTPTRESGKCCLIVEQSLLKSRFRQRLIVLRSAGIYGPGRIPNIRNLRTQQVVTSHPHSWLNLIYVDDLTRIIEQMANRAVQRSIFNVSDGSPVLRSDFYHYVSKSFEFSPPTFAVDSAKADASQLTMDGVSRRETISYKGISNQRLTKTLGQAIRFASYREGIDAIRQIDAEQA